MDRKLVYHIDCEYENIFAFFKVHHFPRRITIQLKQNMDQVQLNGACAPLRSPLHVGDILMLEIKELESSTIVPIAMDLPIVFEDEDIVVVNKPAGLPVHPSIRHYEDTLANGMMAYYATETSPFVFRCMNRLDRDTSGLTVIAKNPFSSAMLQRQVKERQLHRTYLAIVEGHLEKKGTIDAPIGRAEGSAILRQIDYTNGQSAVTHYELLQYHNNLSLASVTLETGRTHQIRVHMHSIGHPLPGDFLYNPTNHTIKRQALHSSELAFCHPVTKQPLVFKAPLPEDMKTLLGM